MTPDLTQTAAPLEVAWTVVCLVATVLHIWAFWDARADVAATEHYIRAISKRARGSSGRADLRLPLAAKGDQRREVVWLVIELAFVALGLYALASPPTFRADGTGNPNAMWLPILAVGVAVISAVDAIWGRVDRMTMLRLTRARRDTLREGEGG